jgi:hypothetical protein
MDPASVAAAIVQGVGAIGAAVDPYVYTPQEQARTNVDTLNAQAAASNAVASAASASANAVAITTAAKWGVVAILGLGVAVLLFRRK